MEKRVIEFTDVTLRDGQQSLFATRVRTDDLLPALEKLDDAGFWSLEVWGGATFDVCLRYLKEDPWDRLKKFKQAAKNTKLEMLLRGQNLVGYRHYPDDVVEAFVKKAAENGIDVFRIFDALNDVRNMEVAITTAKECGKIVKGVLSYTISPVHTVDYYVNIARQLKDLGVDIISIKDQAGILSPKVAYDLVKRLKEEIKLPVHIHSQSTAAMAEMTLLKSVEAGADIIDTDVSTWSWLTAHSPNETMVYVLREFGYETKIDLDIIVEVAEYLKEVRKKYAKYDTVDKWPDCQVLIHQIPGGMMSNFINQLKENNALDKLDEVKKEVARVREDLGYPPLVTPTSQIVGTQALLNVVQGERYKVVTKETRDYVKGLYGRPPAPIKPDVMKKILGDEQPIQVRPADLLEPELDKCTEKAYQSGARNEEDVLSYCLFPQVATEFFQWREKFEKGEVLPPQIEELTQEEMKHLAPIEFNITVHGEQYHVRIAGVGSPTEGRRSYFLRIDGRLEEVLVQPIKEIEVGATEVSLPEGGKIIGERPKAMGLGDVSSPMPGKVTSIKVNLGDRVKKGDVVLTVEAMKMENEIHAPIDGTVSDIFVKVGDNVNPDECLIRITPD
ncbi:sodium-extruding oxaloacetate decarboxylase subunit alpha [Sulfurihydrogenibium azorense]|uniref:sodium-extruding oxaloacetate decarboxylase subunit alpha n=1 Tax=Sulfurihydrogenibium azorense TaxID=309806 RepID=UPI00240A1F37|nr:sodium-extruding oxaloacetate decarboxylase subunit alpha [Sulfurihydrogenibium azorense]MDM7274062.1 sodium-extruding oxaloacetate decarboxylase subunit alpha [Sulfurihydrogenibium azorense]